MSAEGKNILTKKRDVFMDELNFVPFNKIASAIMKCE